MSVTKMRPSGDLAKKRTRLRPSAAGTTSNPCGTLRLKLLPFLSATFCETSLNCPETATAEHKIISQIIVFVWFIYVNLFLQWIQKNTA
jgi:hypothetical protein